MFAEYLQAAMRHAVYERIEDGTYFGSIPGFQGVWSDAATLEEAQAELAEVLEEWILFRISRQLDLPEVDGHTLAYANLTHLGFEGPFAGTKYMFMQRGDVTLHIPNPHQEDISQALLQRILKQAGISREEWEAL